MSCDTVSASNVNLIECHNMLDRLQKVEGPVGEGQFGKVYIFKDLNYAIKVIPKQNKDYESVDSWGEESNSDFGSSDFGSSDFESSDFESSDLESEGTSAMEFFNEVESLEKVISCPNIIKYYGYYEDENYYYLVTEAIYGKEIKEREIKGVIRKDILEFVKQIVKGLSCIHDSGVAHNDISLGNIMYDNTKQIYLFIDFGLSCVNGECDGIEPGNSYYSAPEFLLSKNEIKLSSLERLQKNDLWSLGIVILQEVLWFYIDGNSFKKEGDIWFELDFATQTIKQRKDLISIIDETLPGIIDLAYKETNKNEYIKNLLESLLQFDPSKRKLI
jgi:serine/threonine protein kinase